MTLLRPTPTASSRRSPSQREIARRLYAEVADAPIYSPHGHVDARMLLDEPAVRRPGRPADHARPLRPAPAARGGRPARRPGPEPGRALRPRPAGREVWRRLAEHWDLFLGTPVRFWFESELHDVFGLTEHPSAANADALYDQLVDALAQDAFRPRALFERFGIAVLATTDDPADDLAAHHALRADPTFRRPRAADVPRGPVHGPVAAGLGRRSRAARRAADVETTTYAGLLARPAGTSRGVRRGRRDGHGHGRARRGQHAAGRRRRGADPRRGPAGRHLPRRRRRLPAEHALPAGRDVGAGRPGHAAPPRRDPQPPRADARRVRPGHRPRPAGTGAFTRPLTPILEAFGTDPTFRLVLFTVDETMFSREIAPLAGFYPSVYAGRRGGSSTPPRPSGATGRPSRTARGSPRRPGSSTTPGPTARSPPGTTCRAGSTPPIWPPSSRPTSSRRTTRWGWRAGSSTRSRGPRSGSAELPRVRRRRRRQGQVGGCRFLPMVRLAREAPTPAAVVTYVGLGTFALAYALANWYDDLEQATAGEWAWPADPAGVAALGCRVGPDRVAVVRGGVGRFGAGRPPRAPLARGRRGRDGRRHVDGAAWRSFRVHFEVNGWYVPWPGPVPGLELPQPVTDPSVIPRWRFDPASSRRSRWSGARRRRGCSRGATRRCTRSPRRSVARAGTPAGPRSRCSPRRRRRPRRCDAAAAAGGRLRDTAPALPRRLEYPGSASRWPSSRRCCSVAPVPGGWLLLGLVQLSVVGPVVLGWWSGGDDDLLATAALGTVAVAWRRRSGPSRPHCPGSTRIAPGAESVPEGADADDRAWA